jgi:cytidylate kinase
MLARKKWYRKWLNTNVILPFIKNKSIVIEGRGLKEIVPNPDADFFIKSTIYARAFRRIRQFKKRFGISNVSLDTIYKQIQKRDYLDINRKIAPLRKEKNAKVINNTALKRINSVKRMLFIIHKRFPELTIDWKIPGSLK